MFIIFSSKIRIEKILKIGAKSAWVTCCVFVFSFILTMLIPFIKSNPEKLSVTQAGRQNYSISLEKIGQGPLSLIQSDREALIPDLSQEVLLLGKKLKVMEEESSLVSEQGDFLLSLASSKEEYRAKSGEQIFLSCDPVAGRTSKYHFSTQKTPLWIKPTGLDKSRVLLEVGVFSPSKQSESFDEEKTQFVLREGEDCRERFQGLCFVEALSRAKLWGADVFLSRFGGDEYKVLQNRVKLEIPGEKETVFCFLGEGDFLQWDDGRWLPVEAEGSLPGKPLAQVKASSSKGLEFQVWDPAGFYSFPLKIEQENAFRSSMKIDTLPEVARMRTSKQVSCSFGKKRFLLRQGDWILKTAYGWRMLRRAEDIQSYIHHKLVGELLIFEALVEDQGRFTMKGFWVDKMRTQIQPFTVPVQSNVSLRPSARRSKKNMRVKQEALMEKKSLAIYFPPAMKIREKESDKNE